MNTGWYKKKKERWLKKRGIGVQKYVAKKMLERMEKKQEKNIKRGRVGHNSRARKILTN